MPQRDERPSGVTDDVLRAAVPGARHMRDLLREVGLVACGGNYESVRRRLLVLGLLEDKFCPQPGRGPTRDGITDEALRAAFGTSRTRADLLRAVGLPVVRLAEAAAERARPICLLTEWRGRPMPLELDHVNGDRTDNRLENFRLLCPNCHAQTDTYRGPNIGALRAAAPAEPAAPVPDPRCDCTAATATAIGDGATHLLA